MKSISVWIFTACLLLTLCSQAAEKKCSCKGNENEAKKQAQFQQAFFNMLDKDKDDTITEDEFCNHVFKVAFNYLDKNKDKFVTLDEWLKQEQENDPQGRFKFRDKDKNGKITLEEFTAAEKKYNILSRVFRTLDKNKDGVLKEGEIIEDE